MTARKETSTIVCTGCLAFHPEIRAQNLSGLNIDTSEHAGLEDVDWSWLIWKIPALRSRKLVFYNSTVKRKPQVTPHTLNKLLSNIPLP
jgi:hypothetical protein